MFSQASATCSKRTRAQAATLQVQMKRYFERRGVPGQPHTAECYLRMRSNLMNAAEARYSNSAMAALGGCSWICFSQIAENYRNRLPLFSWQGAAQLSVTIFKQQGLSTRAPCATPSDTPSRCWQHHPATAPCATRIFLVAA